MANVTVNGKQIEVEDGITVLQACEEAGAEIPRFCYHERLSIAGNCRMCLVEVEKSPKPVASCAMPVGNNMVIYTNSEKVKKAREGVMEFLLINHPLDCPICDQGGECDLQDQAMAYGRGRNRFEENKRSVKDKNLGPLVKTHMTRCIHCTRCVRFVEEVAGVEEIGVVGRGEHMEIDTYIEKALSSEVSGNIIDLCPVGALTSKPYAFTARSWELSKTESIDVMDAVGSNIRVDSEANQVMRILPRLHEGVNEEWLADKSRFSYDGLMVQRLDRPYVKRRGKLEEATWNEAIEMVANEMRKRKASEMAILVGGQVEAESIFALKKLAKSLKIKNTESRLLGEAFESDKRYSYLLNSTIAGLEEVDFCLLVGANPRLEAPLVNTRLRKAARRGGAVVANIGVPYDLTYEVKELGADIGILNEILSGKHEICKQIKVAKNPIIIVGSEAISGPDGTVVMGHVSKLSEKYNMTYNFLHRYASMVASLELGFVSEATIEGIMNNKDISLLYLLDVDDIDMAKKRDNCFVIYQGHHGDVGASQADVVLPGATYTEKDGLYVNMEGRVQIGRMAVSPVGEARNDVDIIIAIAKEVGEDLGFTNRTECREMLKKEYKFFSTIDEVSEEKFESFGVEGKLGSRNLRKPIDNYYMTDVISRSSKTMAKCSIEILNRKVA